MRKKASLLLLQMSREETSILVEGHDDRAARGARHRPRTEGGHLDCLRFRCCTFLQHQMKQLPKKSFTMKFLYEIIFIKQHFLIFLSNFLPRRAKKPPPNKYLKDFFRKIRHNEAILVSESSSTQSFIPWLIRTSLQWMEEPLLQ
jgi:hypothetical protein